ncbi:AbrB/MazE/SpoVT family DNA-binding domain-containing protein [Candidatus Saccharibacteria bacterium]|nr:AbrB/MazE/SpoVT family DNA-binding domain-containing protein [Candidatus Saccharibacteria bacterium]
MASLAVTQVGQVTIPKVFREALGIKNRVTMEKRGEELIVRREKTDREVFAELDAMWTPEERRRIKANAGKTARELIEEDLRTPSGKRYFEQTFYGGLEDEK